MIYHLQCANPFDRTPLCLDERVEPSMVVANWKEVPAGKHRPCLRCVRRLNRLRINEKVPAWMIPKIGGES